jgi:hypothetical protein
MFVVGLSSYLHNKNKSSPNKKQFLDSFCAILYHVVHTMLMLHFEIYFLKKRLYYSKKTKLFSAWSRILH